MRKGVDSGERDRQCYTAFLPDSPIDLSHFSICSSALEVLGLLFRVSPLLVTMMSHFR